MTGKITKALEAANELHGETLEQLEDDLPRIGYLITVSAMLQLEGHEEWAAEIGKAASKINEMKKEIDCLRRQLEPFTAFASAEVVAHLRAENEKLRAALKPFAHEAQFISPHIEDTWLCLESIRFGDLRAAAAALKETDNG